MGTQLDESKGSLEGFRQIGEWHLGVTSRDGGFPNRVVTMPWVRGCVALLGKIQDTYLARQVKQSEKQNNLFCLYCSKIFQSECIFKRLVFHGLSKAFSTFH